MTKLEMLRSDEQKSATCLHDRFLSMIAYHLQVEYCDCYKKLARFRYKVSCFAGGTAHARNGSRLFETYGMCSDRG
jgi:hypothetical protein